MQEKNDSVQTRIGSLTHLTIQVHKYTEKVPKKSLLSEIQHFSTTIVI